MDTNGSNGTDQLAVFRASGGFRWICHSFGHSHDIYRCYQPPTKNTRPRGSTFWPKDCWNNIFTHSYCCVETPCFSWGSWTTSAPIKTELAQSGVVCRYLCQAEPGCHQWSFIIPESDSGGPCLMYDSSIKFTPTDLPVVSGLRFCAPETASEAPQKPTRADLRKQLPVFWAEDDRAATGAAEAIKGHGWAVLKLGKLGFAELISSDEYIYICIITIYNHVFLAVQSLNPPFGGSGILSFFVFFPCRKPI